MSSLPKIVLITGANQGIGFEIAKKLASPEYPSYHVLLGSRDITKGQHAKDKIESDRVEVVQINVTDIASIEAARNHVEKKWGRLDVLINNAAILARVDPEASPPYTLGQAMHDSFATNTIGVANVTEAFLPLLHKAEAPRIVMISSTAGSLNGKANWKPTYAATKFYVPAYDCSKAAANMLVLHYKNTLPNKFKVNACCPGFIQTSMSAYDEHAGPAENGAINAVRLATLGEDGETGTFSSKDGPIAW